MSTAVLKKPSKQEVKIELPKDPGWVHLKAGTKRLVKVAGDIVAINRNNGKHHPTIIVVEGKDKALYHEVRGIQADFSLVYKDGGVGVETMSDLLCLFDHTKDGYIFKYENCGGKVVDYDLQQSLKK